MNQEKYIVTFVDYWRRFLGSTQNFRDYSNAVVEQVEGEFEDPPASDEEFYPGQKYPDIRNIIAYRVEEETLVQRESESGASYNMDEHNGGLNPSSRRQKVIIFGDTET